MNYIDKLISLLDKRSVVYYLTIGTLSAVVYFTAFALLYNLLKVDYKIAVSIAYFLSAIFNFLANRYFTFQSHGKDLFLHLIKYTAMLAINYLITLAVVRFIVENLELSPYLGILGAIALTVGSGYLMAKYWVFQTTMERE